MTDTMDSGRGRRVANLVAARAEAATQIGILPVQKVPRVKTADGIECLPTYQHAGARYPVHGRALAAADDIAACDR